MKVLITTGLYPPEIGGPATYSKFLVDQLPRYGYEVEVLAFRDVREYPKLFRHFMFFFKVLARGRHADILYAQDTISVGVPTAFANVFLRKKFVLRIPGDHVWEQGTQRFGVKEMLEDFPLFSSHWHPYLMVLRLLQRFVVKSADLVIVPSKYLERIVSAWQVEPQRLKLVYNGIEEFKDTGNKPVLRGLLKFQGKLLVSIGRLVSWKGFAGLIDLMPSLKNDFPDLKLLIVGNGPDLASLEERARKKGLADDVIFAGGLERDVLIRYIRVSDVFVLNSRYEGLSHQLLEVMAVGVPIVATKVGGNKEVIDHEKNGYLVAPDDAPRMRKYIGELLRNTELRARITAAGKRKVKQFSNEKMAQQTAQLFKAL